jgi:hypothetical protein
MTYHVLKPEPTFAGGPLCRLCAAGMLDYAPSRVEPRPGPAPTHVKCCMCGYALSHRRDPEE